MTDEFEESIKDEIEELRTALNQLAQAYIEKQRLLEDREKLLSGCKEENARMKERIEEIEDKWNDY